MGVVAVVTGVSRYFGGKVADLLVGQPGVDRVIGVDVVPPPTPLESEFIRADIRSPVLGRIMDDAGVDTVVHMGVIATPRQAGGRSVMKDINVIGTMQLLAACQRAESVRNLVVKSTAAVYGSGPRDPALITEEDLPRHPPTSGWAKDSAEVEDYVRSFGRRRSDVRIATLRFANIVGPGMRTGMTSYLTMPVVPTVLGFDPRLQFVHEDDAVDVTRRVVLQRSRGTYNIAGDGVVLLSQAIRMMNRTMVPLPSAVLPFAGRSLARGAWADFSRDQIRYLTYGRALDTSAAANDLGFQARFSSEQALESLALAVRAHG
ncbi:MAG: NAD-dependent epimerase/dehydratase family protein [Actinomycetota bacterium]|nr:NAD-dependent epimerase/dehydratase family protein [Actinomycetota bacterium]